MMYPVPLFRIREWGTHTDAGHTCPTCLTGRLWAYLVCPHCLSQNFLGAAAEEGLRCRCGKTVTPPEDQPAMLQCSEPSCRDFHTAAFVRHAYSVDVPERISGLETLNAPVFASVQHYLEPRPHEGSLHYGDFALDLDYPVFEDALQAVRVYDEFFTARGIPHQVYFSGSKGFHVVVPAQVLGAKPAPDLNHVQYRKLAEHLWDLTGVKTDPAIYSRARLFREPLSIHGKTGLFKIPLHAHELEHARELAVFSHYPAHYLPDTPPALVPAAHLLFQEAQTRVLEDAPTERTRDGWESRAVLDGTREGVIHQQVNATPCVQSALEDGPPAPGTRNKLNKVMAAYFIAQGEGEDAMMDWARHTPGASSMRTPERVQEARGTYRWAKRTGYDFDCRDMREIGLCDPRCPLLAFAQPMTRTWDALLGPQNTVIKG